MDVIQLNELKSKRKHSSICPLSIFMHLCCCLTFFDFFPLAFMQMFYLIYDEKLCNKYLWNFTLVSYSRKKQFAQFMPLKNTNLNIPLCKMKPSNTSLNRDKSSVEVQSKFRGRNFVMANNLDSKLIVTFLESHLKVVGGNVKDIPGVHSKLSATFVHIFFK